DYEDPQWETRQLPTAPRCAGSLVFLKNSCKRPRHNHALLEAMGAVEADTDNVFNFSHEFLEHHTRLNPRYGFSSPTGGQYPCSLVKIDKNDIPEGTRIFEIPPKAGSGQ